MAKNEPKERLRKLQQNPPFPIPPPILGDHHRAKLADQMTKLGYNNYDMPVHRAFDFCGLDRHDPRHWRILITWLALAIFPLPRIGEAPTTIAFRRELLVRFDALPDKDKTSDTVGLRKLMGGVHKEYHASSRDPESTPFKSKLRDLRRDLTAAREHQEWEDFLEWQRRLATDSLVGPFEEWQRTIR